jgi:hypothetical protein
MTWWDEVGTGVGVGGLCEGREGGALHRLLRVGMRCGWMETGRIRSINIRTHRRLAFLDTMQHY